VSNIVIRELLPSDPLSEAVEKINFNFDQLMLAGGGPQGIQGNTGPTGSHGPIGPRGSLWFSHGGTGLTATDEGEDLRHEDQVLLITGDIYSWYELGGSGGSTGWTYSGINIMGPTGSDGQTGGAYEWQFFPGSTGNAQDPNAYGPTTGNSSTTQTTNVDFIVPIEPNKNSLFIGSRQWAYDKLASFNTFPDGSSASLTFQGDSPKITIIQKEVNYAGLNGLAFGAVGLTSSASSLPPMGDLTAPVTAFDFVHLGFVREATLPEKQTFLLNSFRMPVRLQIGNDTSNYRRADFTLNSHQATVSNYDVTRFIRSGQTSAPFGINRQQAFIEIVAKHNQHGALLGGTSGYVSIQGHAGSVSGSAEHPYGFTIIGPTYSNVGSYTAFVAGDPSALIISRQITTYNSDSSIKFYSPGNGFGLFNNNDFIAKFVGLATVNGKSFQISGRRIGINPKFDTNEARLVPLMPFHVRQKQSNLTGYFVGSGIVSHPHADTWMAGFDSVDGSNGVYTQQFGLGIGYTTPGLSFTGERRFPLIQTYMSAIGSAVAAPLVMQIGQEEDMGNLMLGLSPNPNYYMPKSKLSVFGSINVGSTAYHAVTVSKAPDFGIRSEGPIIVGTLDFAPTTTVIPVSSGVTGLIGSTYAFYSTQKVISRNFVATSNNGQVNSSIKSAAFATSDLVTGLRGATYAGEAYITVKSGKSSSDDVIKFSAVSDDANEINAYAVQILKIHAMKPRYLSAYNLTQFTEIIASPTATGNYGLTTIPTNSSVIVLDGGGTHDHDGYYSTWKGHFEAEQGLVANSTYFMVELQDGLYDGQEVEIISNGWGTRGLYGSAQPAFSFKNNARWPLTTAVPKMILQKEFNGGGQTDAINGYGFDGPLNPGFGLPYPFPHGAKVAGPALSNESVDNSKWSQQGQFTVFGSKTIKLRWMRVIPMENTLYLNKYRWVEISRTSNSVDDTITNGAYIGNTGYTVG
jgi:hypothetical protein